MDRDRFAGLFEIQLETWGRDGSATGRTRFHTDRSSLDLPAIHACFVNKSPRIRGSVAIFQFRGFDGSMGELAVALEGLRSELLATRWAVGGAVRLSVTLGLRAEWDADGRCRWRLSEGVSPHVLTVDLGNDTVGDESTPVDVAGELDQVFGPPGFDSAARATVFRETANALDVAGLRQVLSLLESGKDSEDGSLDRARHAMERLLERGPAGVRDGARRLLRLLDRQDAGQLLDAIGSRWRYGTGHGPK